jgi:hypothetical protein
MTLACRIIIAGTLLATLFGSFAAFAQAPPTGSGVVRLQYATAPIIYVNGNGNTVATNGSTASGTHTLQFAATPGAFVASQTVVSDQTNPSAIPPNTIISSVTGTTAVMSNNAAGSGVGSGDVIVYTPFCTPNSSGQNPIPACGSGNDSTGNGTTAAPYLSLSKALSTVYAADIGASHPLIVLAYGSSPNYGGVIAANAQVGGANANTIFITGDSNNQTAVHMLAPNGGDGIYASDGSILRLEFFAIGNQGTALSGIRIGQGGIMDVQSMACDPSWNSTTGSCIALTKDGITNLGSTTLTVQGCGGSIILMTGGFFNAGTAPSPVSFGNIAIPSPISCSNGFVNATGPARLTNFTSGTFTGSGVAGSTGVRAILQGPGWLDGGGASVNAIFPGNSPAQLSQGFQDDFGDVPTSPSPSLPLIIGQSHIPLVLVSSGTMGNNGALSSITAVATAYPSAYVNLPAGAIASGSGAGWYYAVFSSTTAATIYNNIYTSGTPQIPASPTAFSTTGPGSFIQSTSSIAAYALAIAGNAVGPNGSIALFGSRSNNNTSGNKTLTADYGSYAFASLVTTTSGATIGSGFSNRGVTNVQVSLLSGALNFAAATPSFGAIDSTASQNLIMNMQLATATDTMTLENIVVQLIPGVP